MKIIKIAIIAAAMLFAPSAIAQFSDLAAPRGGPVAVGGPMLQSDGKGVSIVGASIVDPNQRGGGFIQLSAFGWLEPYVDTIVQALIAAAFAWFAKSGYSKWMDQAARDALETFAKNRASSLLADGAVRIEGKAVHVDNPLLYRAAAEASTAIPDALKRFGLTPDVVAAKIIDAIPQTQSGAAIIAAAHAENDAAPIPVTDRPSAAPEVATPNQDAKT